MANQSDRAYNYTSIKNRESRIYSISSGAGHTVISQSGIEVNFLKILVPLLFIFNIFGIIICIKAGKLYYIPIDFNGNSRALFDIIFIGIPFSISFALQYIKISSYGLLDYLIAYFRPKHSFSQNGEIIKQENYLIDSIVEKVI